jgi:hypothetical protein
MSGSLGNTVASITIRSASAAASACRRTPTHRNYVVVGKRATDNALLVAFDGADAPGLFVGEVRVQPPAMELPAPAPAARPRGPGPGTVIRAYPLDFQPEEGDTRHHPFPHPAACPGERPDPRVVRRLPSARGRRVPLGPSGRPQRKAVAPRGVPCHARFLNRMTFKSYLLAFGLAAATPLLPAN